MKYFDKSNSMKKKWRRKHKWNRRMLNVEATTPVVSFGRNGPPKKCQWDGATRKSERVFRADTHGTRQCMYVCAHFCVVFGWAMDSVGKPRAFNEQRNGERKMIIMIMPMMRVAILYYKCVLFTMVGFLLSWFLLRLPFLFFPLCLSVCVCMCVYMYVFFLPDSIRCILY